MTPRRPCPESEIAAALENPKVKAICDRVQFVALKGASANEQSDYLTTLCARLALQMADDIYSDDESDGGDSGDGGGGRGGEARKRSKSRSGGRLGSGGGGPPGATSRGYTSAERLAQPGSNPSPRALKDPSGTLG